MRTETSQTGFTVKLVRSNVEVFVPEYSSILHVLLSLGIAIPYSCRGGSCGACEVGVLGGTPDHKDWVLSDDEKASNQSMMVCCSGAISPLLELDL
jgi:ferredoxin